MLPFPSTLAQAQLTLPSISPVPLPPPTLFFQVAPISYSWVSILVPLPNSMAKCLNLFSEQESPSASKEQTQNDASPLPADLRLCRGKPGWSPWCRVSASGPFLSDLCGHNCPAPSTNQNSQNQNKLQLQLLGSFSLSRVLPLGTGIFPSLLASSHFLPSAGVARPGCVPQSDTGNSHA